MAVTWPKPKKLKKMNRINEWVSYYLGSYKVIYIVLAFGCLMLFLFVINPKIKEKRESKFYDQTAIGQIESIIARPMNFQDMDGAKTVVKYHITYIYMVNGKQYTGKALVSSPLKKGTQVQVKHASQDPAKSKLDLP